MATLIGEIKGRSLSGDSRTRTFKVRAAHRGEFAEHILRAVPVLPGLWHPNSFGYFAETPDVTQDPKAWWLWTVVWNYKRLEADEDPQNNPDQNPLLERPEVSIDFQTIEVDARGELQNDGTYRPIKNSAGEPYDPHPREELEIMLISIGRNEPPAFSVNLLRQYQNATNQNRFTFGDATFEAGKCKIRIRVGPRQRKVLEVSQTVIEYRKFNYTIAINPLGWDINLLDWGPSFIDENGNKRLFVKQENVEFGLLDGAGGKLDDDGVAVFLNWENKERVDFGQLTLPGGP